jgi:hypothetical protein
MGRGQVQGGGVGEGSGRPATAGRGGGRRRSGGAAARAGWNKGGGVWAGLEKEKRAEPNGIEEFSIHSKEFQKEVT